MTILVGTDFTPAATEAVDTAAQLAACLREPLRLVHVLDLPGATEALSERAWPPSRLRMHVEGERAEIETRLRAEAARLAPGVTPSMAVLVGPPDEALVGEAERVQAKLVVCGALGRRSGRWLLGSTADRVAQTSSRPVLVVREPATLQAWTRGERALIVLVGVDATPTSDAALRWIEGLRACGRCTIVAAHVYWPPEVRERLGLAGLPIGRGHPEVDDAIARELRTRIAAALPGAEVDLRIVGGLGRTADHLIEIAAEEHADLVVVGSEQREGLDLLWQGSVSRGIVAGAACSVACVPVR